MRLAGRLSAAAVLALVLGTQAPARADVIDDAINLRAEGRLGEALEKAKAAVESHATDPDAHGVLGQVLFDLSRFEEAEASLGKAVEMDPERWADIAHGIAARTAFYRGDDAGARARLAKLHEPGEIARQLAFLMEPTGLTRHRSKEGHYLVHVDETLERRGAGKYAAAIMELVYKAYSKVFPFDKRDDVVYRVYVFGAGSSYRGFYERLGTDMSNAAGFYDPNHRTLVINADPEGVATDRYGFTASSIDTMFHEGFHQFIDIYVPGVPRWFNEGLAEYFGPSRIIGKRKLETGVVVHKDPSGRYTRIERMKEVLRERAPLPHLPLADLLRQRDEDFEASAERGLVNYAQSWSFVHFLLHDRRLGKKGKELIKGYFAALRDGRTREEAHAETFGKIDLVKLEAMWRDYVVGL